MAKERKKNTRVYAKNLGIWEKRKKRIKFKREE